MEKGLIEKHGKTRELSSIRTKPTAERRDREKIAKIVQLNRQLHIYRVDNASTGSFLLITTNTSNLRLLLPTL